MDPVEFSVAGLEAGNWQYLNFQLGANIPEGRGEWTQECGLLTPAPFAHPPHSQGRFLLGFDLSPRHEKR